MAVRAPDARCSYPWGRCFCIAHRSRGALRVHADRACSAGAALEIASCSRCREHCRQIVFFLCFALWLLRCCSPLPRLPAATASVGRRCQHLTFSQLILESLPCFTSRRLEARGLYADNT